MQPATPTQLLVSANEIAPEVLRLVFVTVKSSESNVVRAASVFAPTAGATVTLYVGGMVRLVMPEPEIEAGAVAAAVRLALPEVPLAPTL